MSDPIPKKKAEPWQDPSLDSERESDATQDRRTTRDAERKAALDESGEEDPR